MPTQKFGPSKGVSFTKYFILKCLPMHRKLYNVFSSVKFLQAQIWDYFNKQKQTILISSSQTLEESNLQMDQNVGRLFLLLC